MHDTLEYLSKESIHSKHHNNQIIFWLLYVYSDYLMLVLSRDNSVHDKSTLLDKKLQLLVEIYHHARLLYLYVRLPKQGASIHWLEIH